MFQTKPTPDLNAPGNSPYHEDICHIHNGKRIKDLNCISLRDLPDTTYVILWPKDPNAPKSPVDPSTIMVDGDYYRNQLIGTFYQIN